MTKQAEIHILDEAISKLGADSYFGPWLASVKAQAVAMMGNDIFPDILPLQSAEEAANIRKEALEFKLSVETHCKNEMELTKQRISKLKENATEEIHKLSRKIELMGNTW